MTRRWAMALVLLLAAPLSACATTPQEAPVTLTLEDAKADVRAAEDEVIALIPSGVVTETLPRTETSRTLFACDGPDTYYWPGGAQLQIDPSTDSGAVIGAIGDAWSAKDGWKVTWVERGEKDGVYHLDMLRDDGLHLAVMNLEGNTLLDISSFSPCFGLDDYDPNRSY
ncbi:hypothetical protein [Microbacterium rhizomatis]|uniref:Lipoprotein n=1 Tax=Microbacterium rhizomatis TaxID=1631477 RepID=A0A5J5J1U9_9MICO|nr:hypothetical protein [Microbacterium rhizomatis]KAA9106460.1 hypothetical protein F6B43_15055 [Microbacterium rhizomatis]